MLRSSPPDASSSLFACGDAVVYPAGGDMALFYNKITGVARVIPSGLAAIAIQCVEFSSAEEHAALVVARAPIAAGLDRLRSGHELASALRQLCSEGLLVSRAELD